MALKKGLNEYVISLPINYDKLSDGQKDYLEKRVLDQIKWYDSKAKFNQEKYKQISIATFIISSLIPILTLFGETLIIKIAIAVAASSVSILTYVLNINTYKDLWIQYRVNCEMLKSEAVKFANKIPPYNTELAFNKFVENCEQYFTKEFSKWQNITNQSSTGS